jgi:hypothetical protein
VTVNENVRGQPTNAYIEDAVQETTVATDGVSAEFGRFSGGIVNVITKSGSNLFSGTFRDSLYNDNWRSLVTGNDNFAPLAANQTTAACNTVTGLGGTQIPDPHCFASDTKISQVVPQYEYVFGGPAIKDRLWFFTAGRFITQQFARNTVQPVNAPYVAENQRKRFEVKATGSLNSNHRFEGGYVKEALTQVNDTFNTATSMDLASLYTRQQPVYLFTVNYSGVLSPQLFVEGRFSKRQLTFIGSGSQYTDLIQGTLLLDVARGNLRWNSPTFCGVCTNEERSNDNEFVKVTYFKPTKSYGSHNVVAGYDLFNDKRAANNHQSGSDYRILGTTSIIRGTDIYPQWLPTSTILQYNPIFTNTLGTNFRTHGVFVNDHWRLNTRFTFNLGLRWDKNHGVDSAGNLVTDDSAFSPRLGVVWDPRGDGRWSVNGSFARYTAALANSIADSSSAAGNPGQFQYTYQGPAINPDSNAATLTTAADAIRQVFAWCQADSGGFCGAAPPASSSVPGVSVQIPSGLKSPGVLALGAGVSRQLTARALVRADYSYRDYRDFYSQRIDTTTGRVTDQFGTPYDLALVENTNDMKRRYSGMTLTATYRFSARTDVGGNYTLSRLWGNLEGENVGSGPIFTDVFQYPEYRQLSWYAPEGDLAADQRHRSSLWLNYGVPKVNGLVLSVLQDLSSGLPYGAGGGNPNGQIGFSASSAVNALPYVPADIRAKYVTPQGGSRESYYYTDRDAFRTEASIRTDFAANYTYKFGGRRQIDAFVQAQIINIFDQQDLCACGAADVFTNGGAVFLSRIGSSVLNPAVNPTTQQAFNPLTTTPVQGVNWNYGANFGTPLNRLAFTTPRTFRMTFGVRF